MNYIFIPSVYCFVFMYMVSFIFVISSEDWFLVWMGLEINMMSFIIFIYRRYNLMVIESCLSYFFIQSMGSALLISLFYLEWNFMSSIVVFILSYSIGAGPFFFWFPSLCSGLGWISCIILMLIQKVLPLLLISLFFHWIFWLIVIVSLMVGVFGSFNQNNIKQLMAYSSIHHLGWIFMIMSSIDLNWVVYLILYSLILCGVVFLMIKEEIEDMSQMYLYKYKLYFIIMMLSMGGMPPLLGFFLKWMALINIISVGYIYLFVLVLISVIMLYIYIRIIYDIIMSGGVEWVSNSGFLNNLSGFEIFSLFSIVFGMLLGIIFVI